MRRIPPSRRLQAGTTAIWLILWLVGMAAIAYWCVARHVPTLQLQITNNAQAALSGTGTNGVELSVLGRDATVSGVVADDVQKQAVLTAISKADGIRVVNDKLTIADQLQSSTASIDSNPTTPGNDTDSNAEQSSISSSKDDAVQDKQQSQSEIIAETSDDSINTNATVSTNDQVSTLAEESKIEDTEAQDTNATQESDANTVAAVVNEADEQPRVFEESTEPESASSDTQVAELIVEPESIETESPSEAEPKPEPVSETGSEETTEPQAQPEAQAQTKADTGLSADTVEARALALIEQARRETLNPLIDPETPRPNNREEQKPESATLSDAQRSVALTETPTLNMAMDQGTLTLTGDISDQDSLLDFIRSAMSTFDANYVVNSVQVNDFTEQAEWLPALNRFLPEMQNISNAGIEIIESQITLSGEATSDTEHDRVIDKALFELGELSLVERISVAEKALASTEATTNEPTTADVASDTGNNTAEAPDLETQRTALMADFQSLEVGKILFQSGSDVLTEESLQVIETMADLFAQYPMVDIEIDGHTDASGFSAKNLQLSQLRANAVRDYLVQQGIAADRLSAYGFGDGVPIADNSTPAGRRLNRRIEFNF